MIDDFLHPFYRRHPELMMLDAVLHGLVEQNPPETVLKFIRYSLPKIRKEINCQKPTDERKSKEK